MNIKVKELNIFDVLEIIAESGKTPLGNFGAKEKLYDICTSKTNPNSIVNLKTRGGDYSEFVNFDNDVFYSIEDSSSDVMGGVIHLYSGCNGDLRNCKEHLKIQLQKSGYRNVFIDENDRTIIEAEANGTLGKCSLASVLEYDVGNVKNILVDKGTLVRSSEVFVLIYGAGQLKGLEEIKLSEESQKKLLNKSEYTISGFENYFKIPEHIIQSTVEIDL